MPGKVLVGSTVVAVSLVLLFLLPAAYFVPGTFAATTVMIIAALGVRGMPKIRYPSPRSMVVGVLSAAALYLIFYAGNLGIRLAGVPGLGAANERSIYSLISNASNPLPVQVLLLLFDAVGYESFFRGTLMEAAQPRFGAASAPMVAAADALLHLATFNILWVMTTFVADLVWGLTYRLGKGTQASMTSHFLWDLAIFMIRPIA